MSSANTNALLCEFRKRRSHLVDIINSASASKSVEELGLEDLRIDDDNDDNDDNDDDEEDDDDDTENDQISSFSSSWYKAHGHLIFAEKIISSLENEAIKSDPFAEDSNFTVGADGLITLSSLLSDAKPKTTTRRSSMNRAA